MIVNTTYSARKMLVNILRLLPENEREKFGRELRAKADEIVTGDFRSEYRITAEDIIKLVRDGGYSIARSTL